MFRYWVYLAFLKVQADNRNTKLSFLWEPLTVFFVASVLSIVWVQILDIDDAGNYFLYVLVGFCLWTLLFSKLINRALSSLIRRKKELTRVARPISTLFYEDMFFAFTKFMLAFPVVLVCCLILADVGFIELLSALMGVVLILFAALGLCLSLGVVAFFVEDIMPLVKAAMRLGFLTTPIIWTPDKLGEYQSYVWFNPFYSFLDICRSPLIGDGIPGFSWMVAISITISLLLMGLIVFQLMGRKIRVRVFS